MKIKSIVTIAAIGLLPISGFAQTPPAPPEPPAPPHPPRPPGHHEKGPKVPVTYLGVETSQVPDVVSEQLGLAKGLGLVIEYVEPNSPAASAGIQQNDIIKMLNDQILIEPSQLRKLLQTFSEGTEVTLTILRKGKEQIVFSDDKGELKLENVDGKKLLTVKDPQGKLVFSGPVETQEDFDKLPADVRDRYEKLQQNDLPEVAPRTDVDNEDADDDDAENREPLSEQVSLKSCYRAAYS